MSAETAVRTTRSRCVALAVGLALAMALSAAAAAGQDGARTTPFLPPDHWAAEAVRRLGAAGALPSGIDAGSRALSAAEVAWAFEQAAAGTTPAAALAASYRARFAEEYRAWVGPDGEDASFLAAASAGYVRDEGRVRTGIGYSNVDDWTGTEPVDDHAGPAARAVLAATLGRHVAASITPAFMDGSGTLAGAQLVAGAGPVGAWVGRRPIGYGVGRGGTIVLAGDVALAGGGLFLARPVRLPWVLRHLGPVRFETFLSRIENGDRITDPWFWGARGSLSPHRRLDIGLNRGAMFGGAGNTPVSFRNVLLVLVGEHAGEAGEFANQVLSADARWRPPLGALPLELYAEWGLDDSSGGYWRSPGIIAGFEVAAVPGVPALSLGVERTSFAAASFKNTIWYRNWSLRGGWTHDRRILGHPLGGHGTEWLLYGSAAAFAARVRIDARVALRDRASENLLAPQRTGKSTAVALDVALRAAPWLDLTAGIRHEDGERDWRASRAFTAARAWFSWADPTPAAVPTTGPVGCRRCSRRTARRSPPPRSRRNDGCSGD